MQTIFLAEGEKHVLEALRLILENQVEFKITGEAGHPESLLAQVCQQPPDVILLDWNLPGIHHQRLLQTLRIHCPHTCILATSVQPEQRKIALELGADAFLSKQSPPDQFLTELIEAIVQRSNDRDQI